MTYEETALYAQPADPAAFDLHYDTVHAPLAGELPGLLTYSAFHPDPAAGEGPSGIYLVARVTFADRAAYHAAATSPIGLRLEADMANFASAGVTIIAGEITQIV
ncbi:EthD family reductase [Streptomyces sp. NPDC051572]|uniref:EthD family reductase n=1 Tax=unclassified Streptomyces TaxID=2593676 RepID=UPI00344F978C